MDARNEENLKDLFEKFLTSQQAEQAAKDVQKAERILHRYPAPEPDGELIRDIKAEIAEAVQRRKKNAFKTVVYKTAVTAAAVIILAAISVALFEKGSGPEGFIIIPAAVWESDNIAADDEDLAILTTQVEQIEDEVLAVRLGENGGNGQAELAELEMKLIEINGDFWKG